FNPSRMHIFTHLKESSQGVTGKGLYADGMVEHDGQVGELLKKLADRGLKDNTIVIYTSDNGAQKFSWPDAGVSPFRGEKASTWEGGVRVPLLISWPAKIKKGWVSNEIISLEDMFPTLVAAAGDDSVKEKLLAGTQEGAKTFKVHLDGYNFLPLLTGQAEKGPRETFYYFVDDGTLGAMRYRDYKANFSVQKSDGFGSWLNSQTPERAPILANLRSDPFEEAPKSGAFYEDYLIRHMWVFGVMKRKIAGYAQSYKDFPPRQTGGSFVPKQQ
ncbi:MAG TPA: sulfatase-like hydrolase/transferase, partial [Hyphomicrobiaceae bacterium]|nr:sulfatase-like hydrolase/transferase [Hyphomicrobiaceae bacterium]